jgi:hypothetical protein
MGYVVVKRCEGYNIQQTHKGDYNAFFGGK